MIRADGQSPGKDFERLRLLFQENLSDNPQLEHGGHWDWWGHAETVARRLVHLLKVHMAAGDVAQNQEGKYPLLLLLQERGPHLDKTEYG